MDMTKIFSDVDVHADVRNKLQSCDTPAAIFLSELMHYFPDLRVTDTGNRSGESPLISRVYATVLGSSTPQDASKAAGLISETLDDAPVTFDFGGVSMTVKVIGKPRPPSG